MTTSITWPDGFPTPMLAGYGYQLGDPTQRTTFPVGARVRQVYSDVPDGFQAVTFNLVKSKVAYFQGWWRYTVRGQWFLLPLKAAGVYGQIEVRGVGQPQFQLQDDNQTYQVSFACETRQGTTMDQATYDSINATGSMDAYVALMQATNDEVNE